MSKPTILRAIGRALFQHVVIYCSGTEGEYLHRYKLRGSNDLFAVYIHRFVEPDVPIFHDHPWDFVSIMLAGGYTEHRPGLPAVERRRGSIAYRVAEGAHWVDDLQGDTWTLILRLRRRREWGFWTRNGWTPWRDYVRHKPPRNSDADAYPEDAHA